MPVMTRRDRETVDSTTRLIPASLKSRQKCVSESIGDTDVGSRCVFGPARQQNE